LRSHPRVTNRESADELFVSVKTVDLHLGAIYRKLGIRSRTELASRVAQADGTAATAQRATRIQPPFRLLARVFGREQQRCVRACRDRPGRRGAASA